MAAVPGWYPAGVPGKERWWDGIQWTAHERLVAPPAPAPAPIAAPMPVGAPVAQAPVAQLPVAQAPAVQMGWYAVPGKTEVRWWNGLNWTAYKIKNGVPSADFNAVEPPALAWALGGLFALAGLLNLARVASTPGTVVPAVFFLLASVFWFIGAGMATARRRVAAPVTQPLFDPVVRPLPGETEGPSAGWRPVRGSTLRWWTGVRWAHYITERGRVRPTHFGPVNYRRLKIFTAVFASIGLLIVVTGFVAVAGGLINFATSLFVFGGALMLVAGIVALSLHTQRAVSILPENAPA
ncbi:DUF2510 domain-containing protein [Microbacterium esteraromaticum]|uniref:DUF2510 domain-containing protein n=1 Tax=Microbacterium esteraromaticum TaxID=57043 RepID=UPI001C4FF32B|nr:DUF2510 domain-containing protein [Microbacterium esteraromaticum]